MKFCEKNVLCEKGDEITRFDGTSLLSKLINAQVGHYCKKMKKKHMVHKSIQLTTQIASFHVGTVKKSAFPRRNLADKAVDMHPGQKQTFGITNKSIINNVPVVYMVRWF